MRKMTRTILAATAVIGVMAIPATGAVAAPDTSTITFEVTNTGTLSVAMADGSLSATPFDTSSVTEATGALPDVTVTDVSNPLGTGWTVTAESSDFVGTVAASPHTIMADNVSYWSGAVTDIVDAGGTSILGLPGALVVATGSQPLAANAVAIDTPQTAVVATTATGNHEVTFTPTLIVDLTGVPADTYEGTITHSVS